MWMGVHDQDDSREVDSNKDTYEVEVDEARRIQEDEMGYAHEVQLQMQMQYEWEEAMVY